MSADYLSKLKDDVAPYRRALIEHSVYRYIRSIQDLRIFVENHVYAVWDFMSLLKALQRELTCTEVPWLPSEYPVSRRLVNEIVLGEESDILPGRRYASHFEIYRAAMLECGADVTTLDRFLELLRDGILPLAGLRDCGAPQPATRFVESSWRFLASGKSHVIAAAFTFGREDVIPDMFRAFVDDLSKHFPGRLDLFRYYLERHIDLDEHSHGPMSVQMIQELCGVDENRWSEATQAVIDAITARLALWDGIVYQIALGRQGAPQRHGAG